MIGLFDSGFGGLTVLRSILKALPEYDTLYLGDSARAPYGGHSAERIQEFTREGVEFLFERGARLVILACNTASACALRALQEEMIRKPGVTDRNILGVVVPIAETVAERGARRVALIGTAATIGSGVYENEIAARIEGVDITSKACPLLVPLIEEGWADKMETRRILKSYLRELKTHRPELLVPACTHYPILEKDLKRIMGQNTEVLDTGTLVAEKLVDYIARHPEIEVSKEGTHTFLTTDCPDKFREMGSQFLGSSIQKVNCVTLGT